MGQHSEQSTSQGYSYVVNSHEHQCGCGGNCGCKNDEGHEHECSCGGNCDCH